jgi:hypothetical protein
MNLNIHYSEETIVLRHPTQPAYADSVLGLRDSIAVFFTDECLVFSIVTF